MGGLVERGTQMNVKEMSLPMPKNGKQITNEEWFDTLTTKGKAEVIAQLSSYGGNVEAILVWLKQPHTEKEGTK
jgi:hypothetical protein